MAMDLLHCTPSFVSSLTNFTLAAFDTSVMYSLSSFLLLGSVVLETVFGLPGPSRVVGARDAAILKRSVSKFSLRNNHSLKYFTASSWVSS